MSTTKITVCHVEQYGVEFPAKYNSTLHSVIEWLQAKLESIPAEYRYVAKCEIDTDTYYDSTFATINISYVRPQTEEEAAACRAAEEARHAQSIAQAEAHLRRLKAGAKW